MSWYPESRNRPSHRAQHRRRITRYANFDSRRSRHPTAEVQRPKKAREPHSSVMVQENPFPLPASCTAPARMERRLTVVPAAPIPQRV
jgi:hypothetical protein